MSKNKLILLSSLFSSLNQLNHAMDIDTPKKIPSLQDISIQQAIENLENQLSNIVHQTLMKLPNDRTVQNKFALKQFENISNQSIFALNTDFIWQTLWTMDHEICTVPLSLFIAKNFDFVGTDEITAQKRYDNHRFHKELKNLSDNFTFYSYVKYPMVIDSTYLYQIRLNLPLKWQRAIDIEGQKRYCVKKDLTLYNIHQIDVLLEIDDDFLLPDEKFHIEFQKLLELKQQKGILILEDETSYHALSIDIFGDMRQEQFDVLINSIPDEFITEIYYDFFENNEETFTWEHLALHEKPWIKIQGKSVPAPPVIVTPIETSEEKSSGIKRKRDDEDKPLEKRRNE